MTKIYRARGGSVVWDPDQAKVIARFSKGDTPEDLGTFTTSDPALIARLDRLGYNGVVDGQPEAPVVVADGPALGDDAGGDASGENVAAPVVDGQPEAPKAKPGRKPKAEG